jgi:chemotaxis protein methyltransferase CheR
MTRAIDDQLLSVFSEFVSARFGLHFPRKRWRDLAQKVAAAAGDFGFADPASCMRWLLTTQLTRSQLDTLARRLTIGETYFFREQKSFDALASDIFPELIGSRRGKEQRLRIWSAGCSTGEEAYSIAMLLRGMLADLPAWNITVLATDLNPESLRKAAHGEYGDWSFRGIPRGIKERYFTRNRNGRYEISPEVRKMVTFSQLNLAEDPYPSLANNTNAMDIIFCRNVLMYFTPEQMAAVVERFHKALLDGGWLIVSPCEASHTLFSQYETVSLREAICYRKGEPDKATAASPAAQPVPLFMPVTMPAEVSPSPALRVAPSPPAPQVAPSPRAPKAAERSVGQASLYDEALALYGKGLYAEAASKLSGASDGVSGKGAALLARIFANRGEFTQALAWAEKAIAANKLDPELRYLQATIFQEQGAVEEAVAALKKTLYLDQAFVLAHFTLANLLGQRGKERDAARHLQNAGQLLAGYGEDDLLPGSEGLNARRLREIIEATRIN